MSESGPTVLLTRPEPQSRRFAGALQAKLRSDLRLVISPILRIVPTEARPDLSKYGTIIFTSENGVLASSDLSEFPERTAYCVGDRTAQAAADAGLRTNSSGKDVDNLIARLQADGPPGPWVHLSGEHSRGALAETLTRAGHPTDRIVIYRQDPVALSDEALHVLQAEQVILPVFSPRSADLLSSMISKIAVLPCVVAISDAAAAGWTGPVHRLFVAHHPDAEAMVEAIEAVLKSDSHC
jgi:uroporphyrinogen-III synthase